MVNESNINIAYKIVEESNGPISFASLWNELVLRAELSQEQASKLIGSFYTSLLLDGRFINCGDNTWDLRSKYRFEEASNIIKDVYSDEDISNDDIEIDDPEEYDDEEKSEVDGDDEKSQYEPDFDSNENF